jgi:hypothetical protein
MNRHSQSRINPGGLDLTHNRMNIKGYASRAVGRRLKEASPHLSFLPTTRPLTFILLYEGWPLTELMQKLMLSSIRNLQPIGANAMIVM